MIAITELAIRNGATPISASRVMALGASFVCSVLKTKCPVREACTAISAVSLSRISPTKNNVRCLPQHGPDDAGEIEPDPVLDLHLVDPGQVVFHRVFGSDDLAVGPVQFVQALHRASWSFRNQLDP